MTLASPVVDITRRKIANPLLDKGLARVQHGAMPSPTTILLVDDEPGIRRSLGEALKDEGYLVVKAERGEQAVDLLRGTDGEGIQMMLLDVWLPGQDGLETLKQAKQLRPELPVVMISGHSSIDTALQATKLGAYDFLEKPIDLDRLLLVTGNALRQSHLEQENQRLLAEVEGGRFFLAESPAMKRLLSDVALVAPTEGRVLLTGENGSGKEEVARLLHAQSLRKSGPFVEVNCAAIPEELIESELFGHQKGAFTGAVRDQKGKFREADGGTLFLDEVGDMSLKTQAKVLRALQEGRVEPVGGGGTVGVDVRVITATNKDLAAEITKGRFREDLYFRLAVVPLRIPALRERPEDILPLAEAFSSRIAKQYGRPPKRLGPDAKDTLLRHDWPGNVRELKNLMERAVILGRSTEIGPRDLGPLATRHLADQDPFSFPEFASLKDAKDWFETQYLQRELRLQNGNMTRVAERVGVDRSNLYKRMKALGLEPRES
jgi:two-component system nitrogen regulation response regulator NtrX